MKEVDLNFFGVPFSGEKSVVLGCRYRVQSKMAFVSLFRLSNEVEENGHNFRSTLKKKLILHMGDPL